MTLSADFEEILHQLRQLPPEDADQFRNSMIRTLTRQNDRNAVPAQKDPAANQGVTRHTRQPDGTYSQSKLDQIESSDPTIRPMVFQKIKWERNPGALDQLMAWFRETYSDPTGEERAWANQTSKLFREWNEAHGIPVRDLTPEELRTGQINMTCESVTLEAKPDFSGHANSHAPTESYIKPVRLDLANEALALFNWFGGAKDGGPCGGLATFTGQVLAEVRGLTMKCSDDYRNQYQTLLDITLMAAETKRACDAVTEWTHEVAKRQVLEKQIKLKEAVIDDLKRAQSQR